MQSHAFSPFLLPNGTVLKNRIAKSAMQEKMTDAGIHNQPSLALVRLYKEWGHGGSGLILSGHVMIDPKAMSAPGDVLLSEDAGESDENRWRDWISAANSDGAQFWLQINHPGRQIRKGSGLPVYAPSAVALNMGSLTNMFETPIAMSEEHIQDVVRRFAWTAHRAEELGADGVEIHAAHGYLISQFLSPLVNKRDDKWGGPLENRARLLFEVVKAIRAAVSSKFGVGVKINTADFQRGGFDAEDLYAVVKELNTLGLDLIELSGGSYEAPVMAKGRAASTIAREAYFLEAAKKVKEIATIPVMVTGGIRHRQTLDDVIRSSDKFIAGVGTAMGLMPDLPDRWLKGEDPAPGISSSWFLPGVLVAAAKIAGVEYNLHRIGWQQPLWLGVWPAYALVVAMLNESQQMNKYKRWITGQALVKAY